MTRWLVRALFASSIGLLAILSFSSTALAIDEFPAAGGPSGLAVGPDGNLWFTEETGNMIGRMTPGGVVNGEFPIPTGGSAPSEIAAGPDGNLWFTEFTGNKIGRITTAGTITESNVPGGGSQPDGIVVGPDNNLWFTQAGSNQIGRFSPATPNTIDEFPLPSARGPGDIVVGPDNRLWFTAADPNNTNNNRIGAITTAGAVTDSFSLPTNNADPSGITSTGGALWFTEFGANLIGRISTTGVITEFPAGSGEPSGIATGSDGALWYTETTPNKIGRMTTSGTVTNEFAVPTAGSQPGAIGTGPDGALWFAEFAANKIGRIVPAKPFVPPPVLPPVAAPPATSTKKKCKVPKLKGLTVKKARKKLKRAGCKYKIRGKGKFASSKPKAGKTTTGTVTVKFRAKKRRR